MDRHFLVRRANRNDTKGIYEALLAAFEEYRHFYTPEGFNDTVMSEQAVINRMREMILYVTIDQEKNIIGTIGWQKINTQEVHIRGMAVHPNWQGKCGLASALLQKIEKDARFEECTFITLDTTEILKKAQKFYKKHGYIKTGKTGDFFGSMIYEFAKEI